MKCFYHPDIDATGICKACCKGICSRCTYAFGHAIACKDKCEYEVEQLELLLSRSIQTLSRRHHPLSEGLIFIVLVGLLFFIDAVEQLPSSYFGILFAIICLVVAALAYNRFRHINKPTDPKH